MNQQKWVYGGFLAFSALIGYVSWAACARLAGLYDLETKIPRIDLILQGFGILVAAASMGVLSLNAKTLNYMNEVVSEVGKMTWPTRKETIPATIVVMIMVLICGAILGLFDLVFAGLLRQLLGT